METLTGKAPRVVVFSYLVGESIDQDECVYPLG